MSLHNGYQSANITGKKTVCYTLATISGRFGAKRPEELEGNAPRWITGHAGHEHRVERPQKEKRPHPKAFCFEMPALPVLVPQAGAPLLLIIK